MLLISRAKKCGFLAFVSAIICITIFIKFFNGDMDNVNPDISIGLVLTAFVSFIAFSLAGLWAHFKPHCNCEELKASTTQASELRKQEIQQASNVTLV